MNTQGTIKTKATIDTHGLKITGLRKVAGETKGVYRNGEYYQVNYDMDEGRVWTDYHVSLGQNSWSVYHDASIITICNATCPMTQQEIADLIKIKVDERKKAEEFSASLAEVA